MPRIEVLHFKIARPALPPLGDTLELSGTKSSPELVSLIFDRATVNALLFADDSRLFQRSEALRES